MATPTYSLYRIRRNVRENVTPPPRPPTEAFDARRAAYREILEEIHVLGGDLALDDLTDWIVHRTEETGSLPDVSSTRKRARTICDKYDVILPRESPLRD